MCEDSLLARLSLNLLHKLDDDCQDPVETVTTEGEHSDTDESKDDMTDCDGLELQSAKKMNDLTLNHGSHSNLSTTDEKIVQNVPNEQSEDEHERKQPKLRLNPSLASDPALQPEAKDIKLISKDLAGDELTFNKNDQVRSPSAEILQRMKVFMCHPCGIGFSSLSTLEAHQTYYCSHRKDNEPEANPINLIESKTVPSGETSTKSLKTGKQYACGQCSYSADKKVSLNRHMRMHQPSPVSTSNISNGDENASQQPDRYCSECDIRFSNIKTYRAHKQHYCHSRRMENIPTTSNEKKRERSSPAVQSSAQLPSLQPFLALPTNPILIIPYSVLRMASILPGPVASLVGDIENSSSTCFAYENESMKPIAVAIATSGLTRSETSTLDSRTAESESPLIVLTDSDITSVSPSLAKMCVDDIVKRESSPLDLSVKRISFDCLPDGKEVVALKNDQIAPENILGISTLPNNLSSIKDPPLLSVITEKVHASPSTFDSDKTSPPSKTTDIIAKISELKKCKDLPPKAPTTIDTPLIATNRTLINVPSNLTSAQAVTNIPAQIYVKQGVSKCKECNIVFCKHENYLAHKQHYCSARNKEDVDGKKISSPDDQPDTSQPVAYQQLICAACGIKYTSLDNLRAHQSFYCPKGIDVQASIEKKKCSKCNKLHDGNQCSVFDSSYKCPVCDVVSDNAAERRIHLETHGSVKAFRCIVCRYKGNTLRGMRTHIRMHFDKKTPEFNEEKYMSCIMEEDIAEITSSETSNPEQHQLPQNFKCENCSYSSSYKGNITRHIKLVHSPAMLGLTSATEKSNLAQNGDTSSEPNDESIGVKIEWLDGSDSPLENIEATATMKAESVDNTNNESLLSVRTPTVPPASDDCPLKYCKMCDIKFKYLNSFIAHKKFYCKSNRNTSEEPTLEFHQPSSAVNISKESVETVQ